MRFIGDIHGKVEQYLNCLYGVGYSLQVGDLAHDYSFFKEWPNLSPLCHRFIGGNHDNYDQIRDVAHNLGDFGTWDVGGFGSIFFVRGAKSIDIGHRFHGIDYWTEEEMSYPACEAALQQYEIVKPKLVVSHDCPTSIRSLVSNDFIKRVHRIRDDEVGRTPTMLQAMTDIHRPAVHIFGHFHVDFDEEIDGTRYICLGKASYIDLPASLKGGAIVPYPKEEETDAEGQKQG